jgi:hypothetical protein
MIGWDLYRGASVTLSFFEMGRQGTEHLMGSELARERLTDEGLAGARHPITTYRPLFTSATADEVYSISNRSQARIASSNATSFPLPLSGPHRSPTSRARSSFQVTTTLV